MFAVFSKLVRGFPTLRLLRRLRHQAVSSAQIRVGYLCKHRLLAIANFLLGLASLVPLLTQTFV